MGASFCIDHHDTIFAERHSRTCRSTKHEIYTRRSRGPCRGYIGKPQAGDQGAKLPDKI